MCCSTACALLAHLLLLLVSNAVVPAMAQSASTPIPVLDLNTDNFEDTTQAATGQTTGHWSTEGALSMGASTQVFLGLKVDPTSGTLVCFCADRFDACSDIRETLNTLATKEDQTTLFALVDVQQSGKLVHRFSIDFSEGALNTCRLFRDRQMYAYFGPVSQDAGLKSLTEFLEHGWTNVPVQDVPGPPTFLMELKVLAKQVGVEAVELAKEQFMSLLEMLPENWRLYAGISVAVTLGASIGMGVTLALLSSRDAGRSKGAKKKKE